MSLPLSKYYISLAIIISILSFITFFASTQAQIPQSIRIYILSIVFVGPSISILLLSLKSLEYKNWQGWLLALFPFVLTLGIMFMTAMTLAFSCFDVCPPNINTITTLFLGILGFEAICGLFSIYAIYKKSTVAGIIITILLIAGVLLFINTR